MVDFTEAADGIDLLTNMGETVPLGPDHPLELRRDRVSGAILPYAMVRRGLYARLGRSVYYALAQKFGPRIISRGVSYALGEMYE